MARQRIQVGLREPDALLAGLEMSLHQVTPAAARLPSQRVAERTGRGLEPVQDDKLHRGGGVGSL